MLPPTGVKLSLKRFQMAVETHLDGVPFGNALRHAKLRVDEHGDLPPEEIEVLRGPLREVAAKYPDEVRPKAKRLLEFLASY